MMMKKTMMNDNSRHILVRALCHRKASINGLMDRIDPNMLSNCLFSIAIFVTTQQ